MYLFFILLDIRKLHPCVSCIQRWLEKIVVEYLLLYRLMKCCALWDWHFSKDFSPTSTPWYTGRKATKFRLTISTVMLLNLYCVLCIKIFINIQVLKAFRIERGARFAFFKKIHKRSWKAVNIFPFIYPSTENKTHSLWEYNIHFAAEEQTLHNNEIC